MWDGRAKALRCRLEEAVDLMDLAMDLKIRVIYNTLKHKDNSKCRLEAGAPREYFFNGLQRPALHGQRPTDSATESVSVTVSVFSVGGDGDFGVPNQAFSRIHHHTATVTDSDTDTDTVSV